MPLRCWSLQLTWWTRGIASAIGLARHVRNAHIFIADAIVGMTAASGLTVKSIRTASGKQDDGSIRIPCDDRPDARQSSS